MIKLKLPTKFITKAAVFVFISIIFLSLSLYAGEGSNDLTREILKEKYGDNAEDILKNPGLGHYLDAEEILKPLPEKGDSSKAPPSGTVSPVAEFDPAEAVLIRYPLGIPYSLIADLSNHTTVITLVSSSSQQSTVESLYSSNGVNLANCEFAIYDTDSYWTRDYGPWFIRDGEDDIAIVDFEYNRPRPDDNDVPFNMSSYLSMPYYYMSLYHTGGNYMNDGYSIAASTDLVYEENYSMTEAEVDAMMQDYLGADTYHAVPDPNNTYIDHIDCWGKFLAPNKVLIRRVPTSHAQYDEIEATADYFANQVSAYGTKYKVYRVDTPSDQPYTNSLILNDKVFVPITGSPTYDNMAIAAYQDAMPGYEVEGYTGSWESTDALHCRTHEIADRGMLYIRHYPLMPYQPVQSGYTVTADIIPYSGSALTSGDLKVYYQTEGSSKFSYVLLQHVSGNSYEATIPATLESQTMSYYITAGDASGRTENHPYIGPADPHQFMTIESDIVSPVSPLDYESDISIELDELCWYFDSTVLEIEGFNIYLSTSPDFSTGTYTDYMAFSESVDDTYCYNTESYAFETSKTYYWKIGLVTNDMEIDWTDEWSFVTSSYAPPANLSASTIYSDRIELGWDVPGTMLKGISVSGYNVYRSTQLNGTYTKINSSLVTTLYYTDYSVSCPETWYYAVTAVYSDSMESALTDGVMGMTSEGTYYALSFMSDPESTGAIFTGAGDYTEGAPVDISVNSPAGYSFLYWTGAYAGLLDDAYSPSASFTMPADDVIMTAVFEESQYDLKAVIGLENPAYEGVWLWNYSDSKAKGSVWTNILSGQTATGISAGDITGDGNLEIVVNFQDYGLWYYTTAGASWVNIMSNSVTCTDFALADTNSGTPVQVIASFSGNGLYKWEYSKGTWVSIIGQTATIVTAADINRDGTDDLALAFSGVEGMFTYDFTTQTFTRLVMVSPSQMTSDDITGDGYDEIVCVFDGFGIYLVRNIPDKNAGSQKEQLYDIDLINDIPESRKWYSRDGSSKGIQFNRITYGSPDEGHLIGTGDITGGTGSEIIMTYNGDAYSYCYETLSWSIMVYAPFNRIISGKFTNSSWDDLIVCDSSTGSIYLKNASLGSWEMLLQSGHTHAMAPLE